MSLPGLSSAEAHSQLLADGENIIPSENQKSLLKQILSIVSEPMLILLIAAGVINFFLAEILDAVMLMCTVVIVLGISTVQSRRTENALFALTQMPVISDDTGLEVYALNNAPGVYSARYAGQHGNDKANREKLLHELGNHDNRKARFRTVLHFMSHESSFSAEGICEGRIAKEEAGNHGFGYDSIFIPEGEILTFAEMDPFKKNAMSHRAKAGIELGRMVAEFVQSRNKNE